MRFVITMTCLYSMAIPSHVSMDTYLPIVAGDEGKASGFTQKTQTCYGGSTYPPSRQLYV